MTDTVGPFELIEPLPSLERPRLLMALQPWIDVGAVGTIALGFLEQLWGAQEIAKLRQPGVFYDFSRYRPMLFRREGERRVAVPNTFLRHARTPAGEDWLFLHALEPHSHGEDYVDGVMGLLRHFGVRQYTLAGSMYAPVPHTRPPVASGGTANDALRDQLHSAGVKESSYEGPTTILATLPQMASAHGTETASIIVQLPAYIQLERDYCGALSLLEIISRVYSLGLDLESLREDSDRQRQAMEESVAQNPQLQAMVAELEQAYDSEPHEGDEEGPKLSAELEGFLKDIETRLENPD
ncbi:MAG TPA: PAC2 family protein [Dehalococcoidia bacterium]|nr:PAC2 family protein [Dehalococcoidia bacterium]